MPSCGAAADGMKILRGASCAKAEGRVHGLASKAEGRREQDDVEVGSERASERASEREREGSPTPHCSACAVRGGWAE
eukprot:135399-Rhodomonas_salina.2